MKHQRQPLTVEEIHQHWRNGGSSIDWRPMSIKGKIEWLTACLYWTGLPTGTIPAFDYIIDGSQVQTNFDFYCLLGEVFFGYRGYFGRNLDALDDCFCEIYKYQKLAPLVEHGAKVIMKNSRQIREVLTEEYFLVAVEIFERHGFGVELE